MLPIINLMFTDCSSTAVKNENDSKIQYEMQDTSKERTLVWEEFHPENNKKDFFILRLYDNGDYERFANVILKVDADLKPVYENVEYEWRKEMSISEKGVDAVKNLLSEKINLFPTKVTNTEPTERENSIIRAYLSGKEYILELPNEKFDPERYRFFQEVNELIIQNIK